MAAQSVDRTDDLQHEVLALRKQQQALSAVLRAIARAEGLQVVLDEVTEACRQLCEGDLGALWLLRGDGLLHSVSHHAGGEASRYDREHPHTVDRGTIAGRVALTRAVVHVPDIEEDAEYAYPGPRPFRAMLGAPVMMEDELLGVVVLVRVDARPYTDEQIELLQTFADQAAIALANARLLEAVDRQRGELSRFLAPQVAELVASDEGERLLAGHRAYVTSVFCDLRGFTAFAETAAPEELLDVLRGYHETVGRLVTEHEGTLEHFAGDGLMVFFNDPVPIANHELRATRFALAAQAQFDELARAWRKRGTNLDLGIGIEAGHATVGRIGFEGRYDYGAVGPAVNLASRLSSSAAAGQILVGQRVFAAIDDDVPTARVGDLELKGFARPVPAYEIRSGAEGS
jgi:class 3 adenylate cyclase